jgi:Pvc16 N-terminal domain/Carboxypeptidase regulatory-like domain
MFQDLDATLKAMLADPAAPADLRNAEISFETPDKDFKPAQATVNLFLYDVQENRELRNNAPIMDRVGNQYISRQPPMRIDCTYLSTAWSTKTGGLKTEEEHRLLGLALLWLGRFPVIGNGYLQGSLKNPPQLYPLPAMVAQMKEDQSLGQFWNALGVSPRPAFSLVVTITVQPFDQEDQYPVVQGFQVGTTSLSDPALTGRVLDKTLAPVAAATVKVAETGQTTTTDGQGRFTFSGVATGQHILVVQVTNQPDTQATIDYEADGQVHNVILQGP